MKIHQIDLSTGRWLGQTATVAETAPVPRGWVAAEADPQPGQRWNLGGWHGMPVAIDTEARKARLEAAYHAMVAGSLCNLQSQTAWLGAIALQQPCNQAKILECRAWLDRLWAQYHLDKAAGLESPTFAEPAPSYSFLETMTP